MNLSAHPFTFILLTKHRLTASVIASHFKHRCDRLFRYNTVPGIVRGRPGTIGWRVPAKARQHTRPGANLLMKEGDAFEVKQLNGLIESYGANAIHIAGIDPETNKVIPTSFNDFLAILTGGSASRFYAQIELDFENGFSQDVQDTFLSQYGLNSAQVQLTKALPDLIEILPAATAEDGIRLRIWDFKASRKPRHEHYIQVAFYSLLLEHVLRYTNQQGILVDTQTAVIQSKQKRDEFELAPYRTAVINFLRDTVPVLLATAAADAHFHYCENCILCEYAETCRSESDAGNDLSRVPLMSSISKRRLRRAGIPTHRELAALHTDTARISALRLESHDLSKNLHRYVKAAQTLEDGQIRSLEAKSLLMPLVEDVRIILSAEQDPVSATCFALGMKTFEGWDETEQKVLGQEQVFISEGPEQEGAMLLSFLRVFNDLLVRVDAENKTVNGQQVPADQLVADAEKAQQDAEAELAGFKLKHPQIRKTNPAYDQLIQEREQLQQAIKDSKTAQKEARREASSQRWRLYKRLHIYVYDSLDLTVLKECLERHLLSDEPQGLLDEVRRLIRIFPPESVLPDSDTYRTVPGTVVSEVIKQSLTLPIAYGFDLAGVSRDIQPVNRDDKAVGYEYKPRFGFGWPYSNQVAFERIHDVWRGEEFKPDPMRPERNLTPDAIQEAIGSTIRNKLRATDSVIRAIKQRLGSNLLLKKEPFTLNETFDPSGPIVDVDAQRVLEVMEVFTVLEESFSELAIKHLHTLPVAERVAKFECIRGLQYVSTENNLLQFSFDPECRDAKIEAGNFNLVLTSESNPDQLIVQVDGQLFRSAGWIGAKNKVTLVEINNQTTPPTLWVQTEHMDYWQNAFSENPDDHYALDPMYVDYNSKRVLRTIQQLKTEPGADHVRQLVAKGRIENWNPFVTDPVTVESELIQRAGTTRSELLNEAQWRSVFGVFTEPISLIWGPPGTGKTHTVAHMLLGYALAAKLQNTTIRILVTAFTHHAIVNVLAKTIELAERYGIGPDMLGLIKVAASGPNVADSELSEDRLINEDAIVDHLQSEIPCIIVGSTVWGVYKAMKELGIPQSWFDVVLVDEASQMKLADALIAMASSKPSSSLILAGDDKQLPPILHGTYNEEHKPILSSVFVFFRDRFERELKSLGQSGVHRALFQLEENFRMNEPLTAYPRQVIYGNYVSTKPTIQIRLNYSNASQTTDPFLNLLMDPAKPVILVRYTPAQSYTAKNPIEVSLITEAVSYLATRLTINDTDDVYPPKKFAEKGVAVLAPHRAQNAAIRNELLQAGFGTATMPMPLVDTVEKLQGKERSVVFVSYGVADDEYAEAEAAFLLSENRFNVATTRAERKLIVFCADPVINVVPTDRQTLLDATMLKEFKNYCVDGQQTFSRTVTDVGNVELTIHWKGF